MITHWQLLQLAEKLSAQVCQDLQSNPGKQILLKEGGQINADECSCDCCGDHTQAYRIAVVR